MGKELIQLMYNRAGASKNPEEYIEIVQKLYRLMDLPDDKFIKEMEW